MQCLKRLFHVAYIKSRCYNRINLVHRKRQYIELNFVYRFKHVSNMEFEGYEESEEEQEVYKQISENYLGIVGNHNVFVLQPYIKWGVKKKRNTTRELQLAEAIALVNTLPNWSVAGKKIVPLLSLQKKQLVGTGALKTLKQEIAACPNVTAIFVSTNLLRFIQIAELQEIFELPIYDRYTIVIHIFREHAKTQEAKLQVALAEIPYVRQKMVELHTCNVGKIYMDEKKKRIVEAREKKLKRALKKIKDHRNMLKSRRQTYGFPSIAVVGYTNAGKTSLIKALTGDASLEPKNKLFATLDTTIHQGYLPNMLKVLYIDTIGFIQDVPETLIEPFKTTLGDAIDADIVIHVYDISHPDVTAQIDHIENTIKPMIGDNKIIINVANKCDVVDKESLKEHLSEDTFPVSAVKLTGIGLLQAKLEEDIMKAANLIRKRVRVQVGTRIEAWLHKEATVTNVESDSKDPQYVIMDIILTESSYYKLKRITNI